MPRTHLTARPPPDRPRAAPLTVTRTERDRPAAAFVGPVVRTSQERPTEIHAWLPPLFIRAPDNDRADPLECVTCEHARRGTSLRWRGDRSAGDSSPAAIQGRSVPGTPGTDRIRPKRLRTAWLIPHDAKGRPNPFPRTAIGPTTDLGLRRSPRRRSCGTDLP
ncbi:hypothetical protein GCM10010359_18670 [Streptomyces morookaense]|nr:hypothetical protein GCM10010359_18670 [Streptomyces morookaense]